MNQEPRIRYTRVRKVHDLVRANNGDAGLDFFFPEDLTLRELRDKQSMDSQYGLCFILEGDLMFILGETKVQTKQGYRPFTEDILDKRVISIDIKPCQRVLIPSGVKVLLEPKDSMLMAANKSGIATKQGLIYGAEIVDSPYTGEVHISLINTSKTSVTIEAGKKLVQFIHVPIYLSEPEEIPNSLYDKVAENWGTRGSKAFGSSDEQTREDSQLSLDLDDELAIRDAQFT